jgi:hypothetical protein
MTYEALAASARAASEKAATDEELLRLGRLVTAFQDTVGQVGDGGGWRGGGHGRWWGRGPGTVSLHSGTPRKGPGMHRQLLELKNGNILFEKHARRSHAQCTCKGLHMWWAQGMGLMPCSNMPASKTGVGCCCCRCCCCRCLLACAAR